MLAKTVMEEQGYETVSAATVAEAEAIINDKDQDIDLLFTDIELGKDKEGGVTLAKLFAEARPGTPVLYTSGRTLTDGMQSLFVAPSAFLAKLYTVQDLTEGVSKLLASRERRLPITEMRKCSE